MKKSIKWIFTACLFTTSLNASAAEGGGGNSGSFGLNVALGLPFLTQIGINYFPSSMFSIDLGYNMVKLNFDNTNETTGQTDTTELSLKMPEVILKWHPFSGTFFIGGGIGKETLTLTGTEASTGETIEIETTANTAIGKLGWMWGSANAGFWYGLDFSYISPSGAETTITTNLASTNEAYIDAQENAEDFGEKAYWNFTFARFGWLF